jgi:hypothetical protein
MKTVVLTVEVQIDEKQIIRKYPNFGINYELKADSTPSDTGILDFAKSCVMTEDALADFGFSTKITDANFKKSGKK